MKSTSITVKKTTRAALGELAAYGDSMDSVIMRLIAQAKAPLEATP